MSLLALLDRFMSWVVGLLALLFVICVLYRILSYKVPRRQEG